jgi:hypothetical protein
VTAESKWRPQPSSPIWTIVRRVALYRNEHSIKFVFPVIELQGVFYLKSQWGQRALIRPYEETFDDVVRGFLTFVRSSPEDPKIAAIRDIGADICLLTGPEFNRFLENYPEFKIAFEDNFAGQPLSRLVYFSKMVSEELWRREEKFKEKHKWCN